MANFAIPGHNLHFDRSGTELEQDFMGSVRTCIDRSAGKHTARSTSGTYLDREQGTDALIDGMRIDITQDFSGKDHMPLIMDSGIPATRSQNFQIGIRVGNNFHGYTQFERPVIVVGFDATTQEYRQNDEIIMENLAKHGLALFDRCRDAYCDFMFMDKNPDLYLNPNITKHDMRHVKRDPEIAARLAMQTESSDKTHESRIRDLESRFGIDADDDPFYDIERRDSEMFLS